MRRKLPGVLGGYAAKSAARFHMPGHKGRGMAGFFNSELISWDITELSFSDNLNNPSDSIQEAQEACAARFGAEHTFFLVNGSTAGIHAFMLALPENSEILVARDCHRSVLYGAGLAGHYCRFISPEYMPGSGLYGCLTARAVDEALTYKRADAVIVTSPSYYGLCADIAAISRVTRKHRALLFVDAAHGAHFAFSDRLPTTPSGFADAWVNSAHKTLNALGQAAYLHISDAMDKCKVQRALGMTQTSSPSYLLLASLDWARYTAGISGAWTDCVSSCNELKTNIDDVLGLKTLNRSLIGSAGIFDMDETRVVIDVSERGISGYDALSSLEENDVYVEMADERRIVLICTPSDGGDWNERLLTALESLSYGMPKAVKNRPPCIYGEYFMPIHRAIRSHTVSIPLSQAAGRVAADAAGVYPPGIPLFVPGEKITDEHIAFLLDEIETGASLFGVNGGFVTVVD